MTRDGSLSAHFEHTVAVTKDGPLVLTAPARRGAGGCRRVLGGAPAWPSGDRRRGPSGAREVPGVVLEQLPNALYRVVLDSGHEVAGARGRGPARNFIRVLVGDRVRVELSPRDLTRGRIVERL